MSKGQRTGYAHLIDRHKATQLPNTVCPACRHTKALHRDKGPCQYEGCRCLKIGTITP